MSAKRRYRLLRTGVIAIMIASIPLAIGARQQDLAPPIRVQLEGKTYYLHANTTLGEVIRRFHLKPSAGNLLDVQGEVLQASYFPGHVLVNGHIVSATAPLPATSSIEVQNGETRKEPVAKETNRVVGGLPGNPQYFLGTEPGVQVITRGTISGEIVSVAFKPSGPARRPKAVALTFDDGPSLTYTRQILSVLERYHVRATFFVIGFLAQARQDLVRAEIKGGMSVGNHSWTHPNVPHFNDLPASKINEEIGKTAALLTKLGATSGLFRPPGGWTSPTIIDTARRYDDRVVMWNVDPRDWQRGRTAAQIASLVLSNVRPGSIVVMHDGSVNSGQTAAALPRIIQGIKKKGLQLVALGPRG